MATQSNNNYTITNVIYSVTGGANVVTNHPTAVLTITADSGYSVDAEDFTWTNTTLANINTVVFTQGVSNTIVICTVTFDSPFAMPSADTVRSLCITGAAVKSRVSIDGLYQANVVSAANMTIISGSPAPEVISYNTSGVVGNEVLIIEKTYTAASNYYFSQDFLIEYELGSSSLDYYDCVEVKTIDSSGRLTSINLKFYYTFPSLSYVNDKIKVSIPATKAIKVTPVKITSYSVNISNTGAQGDIRTVRIFGAPTATFTLASNNGTILSFNTFNADDELLLYATTPTLTIPAAGYFDINIKIPAVSSNAVYCFTIAGGNLISPFTQVNPFCIYQYVDTTLTFTASGTNMSTSGTSTYTKSFPALSQASVNGDAYNNPMTFTVAGSSGQALSLATNFDEESWSNSFDVLKDLQATISNANVLVLANTTNLAVGSELQIIPNIVTTVRKITAISGNNVTIDGAAITVSNLTNFPTLAFTNRKKSELALPAVATLNDSNTVATVTSNGYISKYGDGNVTFNLNLADLLTVGSANGCVEYNITVGALGGTVTYFDCITKSKRVIFVSKGDGNFSICALSSPAVVVTGSVSAGLSGDTCDSTGVDQTCVTWSVVYNPIRPLSKSVDIKFINCETLAVQVVSIGLGSTATTQCATRQPPISSDPGDGGATITLTNLSCTP